MSDEILTLVDVHIDFPARGRNERGEKRVLRAVNGVNLSVNRGETLGLVGESGCGKTTLIRGILGLQPLSAGAIFFDRRDMKLVSRQERRAQQRDLQVVFQDPFGSLDPRMTVHEIIAEPLRIAGIYSAARVKEIMDQVGLSPDLGTRRPAQFSGGQRQRIGIARALSTKPSLVVLDEPVSALDVSIQAQVINLLKQLQRDLGLSYLFVGHDLSVVRSMSHRVAVMYLGRIVETGTRDEIFDDPRHPYTQSLLSSLPVVEPRERQGRERIVLQGDPPDPADPPSGCAFRSRCFRAQPSCAASVPELFTIRHIDHDAACFFPTVREEVA
jgi:peptide/nickel transport system ATP-binding protein/oligopeptide transport system ATP-binding protein